MRTVLLVTLMSFSAAADPSVNPSAHIVKVDVSKESAMYWSLKVGVLNAATPPCYVTGYRFTDGTWTLDVKAKFTIPGTTSESRFVRVNEEPPNHFSTSTHVELIATCL